MCQSSATRAVAAPENPGAFAESMIQMFNNAATALMVSVGHRTGLFDAMARGGPWTTDSLAREAGLSERYVREWLGAMTTGRVVDLDPLSGRFTLPPDRAAFLTRAGEPSNLGVTAQWFAVLGSVETQVVEAFRHGRGVPYSAYGQRFHDVMADESRQTTLLALDEHILPLVPGLAGRLRDGIRVLDVGCGKGLALLHMAKQYPRSQFTGVDLSAEAVAIGRREADAAGVTNFRLEVGDVTSFGRGAEFHLVTAFDAIHDQARPAEVLANIRRVLKPDGTFLMQEIKARTCLHDNMAHPLGPFLYTISCMHCMSVSLANGGPGLGAAWGREKALQMLEAAGFGAPSVHELPHDMINDYYIVPRG